MNKLTATPLYRGYEMHRESLVPDFLLSGFSTKVFTRPVADTRHGKYGSKSEFRLAQDFLQRKGRKVHTNYVPVSSCNEFIKTFATCFCFLLADEQTKEQTEMALV